MIRGLKKITAAKIGDFYGESVPYLSEWTHGECLKKLNLVCQNEHRSEGVTMKRLYSFFLKRLFCGRILMKLVILPCTYLFDTTSGFNIIEAPKCNSFVILSILQRRRKNLHCIADPALLCTLSSVLDAYPFFQQRL